MNKQNRFFLMQLPARVGVIRARRGSLRLRPSGVLERVLSLEQHCS